MRSLLRLAVPVYVLAACLCGQERHATVKLDGGVALEGAIVAMDEKHLELRTADGLVSIPSERIRWFAYLTEAGEPERPEPRHAGRLRRAATAPPEELPASGSAEHQAEDPPAAPIGEVGFTTRRTPSPNAVNLELAAGADETDEVDAPFDLRHPSRFAARVAVLDARYPWLVPSVPMQWASLALALFALLSLAVQSAVKVASGEVPEFSRSVRLAAVYLLIGAAQFVFVPSNDFAVAVALLANPAVVLFLLCRWFGLGRVEALLSLAVQLGFFALGFGTLELVDALLASIGTPGC